jgi:predicted flap endonuclease-1-like 5' DNA nuclease
MFENNAFATHTIEILIMLLGAFFIGLWLGWIIWGRLKQELDRMKVDNQSLNVTLDALHLEMEAIKARATEAEAANAIQTQQIVSFNRDISSLKERSDFLDRELATAQQINRQVNTELSLSYQPDTPVADNLPLEIQELVTEKPWIEPTEGIMFESLQPDGEKPVMDIPESAENEAEEEHHKAGSIAEPAIELPLNPVFSVEPKALSETKATRSSKNKPQAPEDAPEASADVHEKDDLTVVEGIGPKIQMLLNQYGISTYRQLAEADVSKLKEILTTAGPQLAMHDPGTWPSQANLAANDQWDTLKSVQGFLKGGKKPE